jgi:hypothetical protein
MSKLKHWRRFLLPRSKLPTGWSYNPAALPRRIGLLLLALLALGINLLNYIAVQPGESVWTYLFTSGTRNSSILCPDSVVSVIGFSLVCLLLVTGGQHRWKTQPWAVILFATAATALACMVATQTILKVLVTGKAGLSDIISTLIAFFVVAPAMAELLATLQHLKRAKITSDNLCRFGRKRPGSTFHAWQ